MIYTLPLRREDWESLHSIALATYLDGACYEFAAALHLQLGWRMVGLMQDDVIRHAVVHCPLNRKLYDVRGEMGQDDEALGAPFGLESPYVLRPISLSDLRGVRPLHEFSIDRAAKMAETLWPDLPWKNGEKVQMEHFARELEELSKRWGVYIRGPYTTTPPIMSKACGDEAGYTLQPSSNTGGYFINRILEGELAMMQAEAERLAGFEVEPV